MKQMRNYNGIIRILLVCILLLAPMVLGIALFYYPRDLQKTKEASSGQTKFWNGISSEHEVTFLDYDGNVLAKYCVKHGECLPQLPSLSKEEYIFLRWDFPLYLNLDASEYPIMEDMTVSPIFLEQSLLAANAMAIADLTAENVDIDAMKSLVEEIKQKGAANELKP